MSAPHSPSEAVQPGHRVPSDIPFFAALATLGGIYVVLVVALVVAEATVPDVWTELGRALGREEIRYSIRLSLLSSTLAAILSLWVAVPLGYVLSRFRFPGRGFLDALLDVPIVLPPLVIGISLLLLMQTWPGKQVEKLVPVTFEVPGVVLAQFAVASAFAVRTMRVTFDQIDTRREQVALTLGCNRRQAFFSVVLPEARRGIVTAGTLAWARSMGEFGPILVFAGSTRMRTEVLPTSIFLELSTGRFEAAAAISLLMISVALVILVLARAFGQRGFFP